MDMVQTHHFSHAFFHPISWDLRPGGSVMPAAMPTARTECYICRNGLMSWLQPTAGMSTLTASPRM
jgi:hypothetical protein